MATSWANASTFGEHVITRRLLRLRPRGSAVRHCQKPHRTRDGQPDQHASSRRSAHDVHGAASIVSVDGTVIHLAHCVDRDSIVLRPGDVVERMLADDDVVVFNRQPSLHMHGMQAHKVRLMPGHTFRLSLPVATPYNADFDGDEMNLHVPQSVTARAECASLMAVASNVVGAQSNKPVMGIVQDSLLALHKLTLPDTSSSTTARVSHARRRAPRTRSSFHHPP